MQCNAIISMLAFISQQAHSLTHSLLKETTTKPHTAPPSTMPSISVLEESSSPQPSNRPLIQEVGRGDSSEVEGSEPPPSTLLIEHVAERSAPSKEAESAPLKEAPQVDCELCAISAVVDF